MFDISDRAIESVKVTLTPPPPPPPPPSLPR